MSEAHIVDASELEPVDPSKLKVSNEVAIEIVGMNKWYGQFHVLRDINLTVRRGERIVIAAPESCPYCGSAKLSKLGEDITETLEVIPRQWKVIQTVREKFSCRTCETITQPPAPFHVTPRGFAGPNLLAIATGAKASI